jgi:hypothetical protein
MVVTETWIERERLRRDKPASKKSILLQPMDTTMRTLVKIIVAAALTGAAGAPAYAYETSLEFQASAYDGGTQVPHAMKRNVLGLRNGALGAMAHEPAGAPPAYDRNFHDFGIGSQS